MYMSNGDQRERLRSEAHEDESIEKKCRDTPS